MGSNWIVICGTLLCNEKIGPHKRVIVRARQSLTDSGYERSLCAFRVKWTQYLTDLIVVLKNN